MGNDEKKELLKETFENINYWLAFGEAKNAGLLAFNVAVLAVIFSMDNFNVLIYIIGALVIISTSISLLALWSRNSVNWRNKNKLKESDNLLFFEDISKYDKVDFIVKFYKDYFKEDIENIDNIPLYNKNILLEIHINAKIATIKFSLFNKGVVVDLVAIVVAFATIIMA